MTKRGLMLLLS